MDKHPKIIMLGDTSVGKTAIVRSLVQGTFSDRLPTTLGACFQRFECQLENGKKASMDIWDTAGQEKYRSLLTLYYKNCDGIIIVFDLARPESLTAVKYWADQIHTNCQSNPVIILAGNKFDLKNTTTLITQEMIKELIVNNGWRFMYCSAKTGMNIKEMFDKMGTLVLQNLENKDKEKQVKKQLSNMKIKKRRRSQNSGCC